MNLHRMPGNDSDPYYDWQKHGKTVFGSFTVYSEINDKLDSECTMHENNVTRPSGKGILAETMQTWHIQSNWN